MRLLRDFGRPDLAEDIHARIDWDAYMVRHRMAQYYPNWTIEQVQSLCFDRLPDRGCRPD